MRERAQLLFGIVAQRVDPEVAELALSVQRQARYPSRMIHEIAPRSGVAFPLADAYMKVRAADLMRYEAARAVGELRRPTRPAWLVNLAAREAADDVARYAETLQGLVGRFTV